jgi:uncharacterized protein
MNETFSRDELLNILRAELPELRLRFGVERIAIFGSYAKGTAGEQSDVDILVQLARPMGLKFFGLAIYLEEKLGRRIDLITLENLHRNVANPRRAEMAAEIERSLLYA